MTLYRAYAIASKVLGLSPFSGIPVILYHRIGTDEDCKRPGVSCTSIHHFSAHINFLCKAGYYFASLDEIVRYVKKESSLPQRTIVLTFDDGFRDNYEYAFPILKKTGTKATLFVNTDFVGKELTGGEAFGAVIPERKNAVYHFLSWNEIEEMNAYGIDFEPHTHTHVNLIAFDRHEVEQEIILAKTIIEERLGKKANHFSYPYGRYNDKVVEIVRGLGFHSAWAVKACNVKEGMDLFILPRKKAGDNLSEFKTVMSEKV